MISRHWKGTTKPGLADRYIAHLRQDTFAQLAALAGYRSAYILTREVPEGTEFQIITLWDSMEAVRAFAGAPADVAVVPPVAQAMMAHYDSHVVHYEIAGTHTSPLSRS